jgi:hypothetical protein
VVVVEVPASGRISRRDEPPQAGARDKVDPARDRRREVEERRDPRGEHLAVRDLGGGLAALLVEPVRDDAFVETGHVHLGHAVLFADALEGRLGGRMRVQVDEAGDDEEPAPVDDLVDGPGV